MRLSHRAVPIVVSGLVAFLAACGGHGSSGALPPGPDTQTPSLAQPSPASGGTQALSSPVKGTTSCPTIFVITPGSALIEARQQLVLRDFLQVRQPFFHGCRVVSQTSPPAQWHASGGSLKVTNGNTEATFSASTLGKYSITATYASYSALSAVTVQAANETVLANLGVIPNGSLLADSSGAFYGVGYSGNIGPCYCGSVYKLARGASSYTTIHAFAGGSDGSFPYGALVAGSNGVLYGTTASGGSGNGTVYRLTPNGAAYSETILYRFHGGNDGSQPLTGLVAGASGALFGTTSAGGTSGNGTAFKLTPQGSGYVENVLYSFKGGSDAASPGTLIAGSGGVFYGAAGGGPDLLGMIFELTPSGSTYTERVLYRFQVGSDGATGDVVRAGNGTFYGTTGGTGSCLGSNTCGTVYALIPSGSSYTERILHRFQSSPTDGAYPNGVLLGTNGTLYGTTIDGGLAGDGTTFKLTPSGSTYTETILHSFAGSPGDGTSPVGHLITNGTGALYGVTQTGGTAGAGTLFKVIY